MTHKIQSSKMVQKLSIDRFANIIASYKIGGNKTFTASSAKLIKNPGYIPKINIAAENIIATIEIPRRLVLLPKAVCPLEE